MNDTNALNEWLKLEAAGRSDERVEEALVRVFPSFAGARPGGKLHP